MDVTEAMHPWSWSGAGEGAKELRGACPFTGVSVVHDYFWWPVCHHNIHSVRITAVVDHKVMAFIGVVLKAPISK